MDLIPLRMLNSVSSPAMADYKQLSVWKFAHLFALGVYRGTESFPTAERFGLVAQLRRAAVSVVSNIAEGSGRRGDREFARFLRIAYGSTCEVESQLLLSRDLGYLGVERWTTLDAECQKLGKMLNGLIRYAAHPHNPRKPRTDD
jgi:four helix bundle protein